MSEVETFIAVAGTLGGTVLGLILGYFLDERREVKRLARETSLSPLPQKLSALESLHDCVVDLYLALMRRLDEAKGQGDLMENIRALDRASLRANLWLTNDAITKMISGRRKIMSVLLHVIDDRMSERDADELVEGFTEISESISIGLGSNIMEDQIRKLAKSVGNRE